VSAVSVVFVKVRLNRPVKFIPILEKAPLNGKSKVASKSSIASFSISYLFGAQLALGRCKKNTKSVMKRLFKGAVEFTKREWFLLVAVAVITLLIVLFEVL
jgi:hypothetical protein